MSDDPNDDNIIVKSFASPSSYLEWASNAPAKWKGELSSREVSNRTTEFTGTKDYDEVYTLALYGWEDGLKMLSNRVALAPQISPVVLPVVRRHDVAGYFPSPGRAAAGEIFSMVAPGDSFKRNPALQIKINCSYPSRIDSQKVMNWGAALVSYVNALERSGRSVQLDWIGEWKPGCGKYGPDVSLSFPLKKAGDALSLASVVFWLAHPSASRRIGASALERLDIEKWYNGGYGIPAKITPDEAGTLYLSIDDAADTFKDNLENIRRKHLKILDAGDPLRDQLGQPLLTARKENIPGRHNRHGLH